MAPSAAYRVGVLRQLNESRSPVYFLLQTLQLTTWAKETSGDAGAARVTEGFSGTLAMPDATVTAPLLPPNPKVQQPADSRPCAARAPSPTGVDGISGPFNLLVCANFNGPMCLGWIVV